MVHVFRIVFFSIAIMAVSASAQRSGLGLGVMAGDPSGIAGKYWLSSSNSINGVLGWSVRGDNIYVHADYAFHKFDLIRVPEGSLPLYFGIGGRMRAGNDVRLGVRVPVGLVYLFEGIPLDAFFELAPIVDVLPGTDFDLAGGIGVRFFF